MGIIPKIKKPLKSLTRLDAQQEVARFHAEEDALLQEMGQENELRAKSTVQEFVKEQDQESLNEHYKSIELLDVAKRNKKTYQRLLCLALKRFLLQESIPNTYQFDIESNDIGIVIKIQGTDFVGAFKVIGISKYDLNACKILAVKAGNTIARLEGHFRSTESGILIATEGEANIAKTQWLNQHPKLKKN